MKRRIIDFVLVLLCVLGLADALFLYVQDDRGTVGQFCQVIGGSFGANCEQVLLSAYAEAGGVKLTVWGIMYYLSLLWISVWARLEGSSGGSAGGRAARIFLPAVSGIGFIVSIYLTYLQSVVIKAWCPFCVASACLTTLILILSLVNLQIRRASPEPDLPAPPENLPASGGTIGGLVLVCVILAAGLVVALLVRRPQEADSAIEKMMPYVPRRVTPPGGLVYGYDTAPVTVQAFLDYTCAHCRTFETQTFVKVRPLFIDSGKVKWINKLLPHADKGAPLFFGMAGICGRDLPERYAVDQAFFTYPIPSPKEGLAAISDALYTAGLDTGTISSVMACMEDRERFMRVHQELIGEVSQAISFGLKGPPAFVIDGIAFQGSMEFRTLAGLLEMFQKHHGQQ